MPSPIDHLVKLSADQRRAATTIDSSLLVSAAAGSGKTTVLAERCAYLVCDLPAEQRCPVEHLLVVTFTEKASTEMRQRIGAAIRKRLAERPNDRWLREQLYLLDSASISTIHSFCHSLIQRWFPQADLDPQPMLLSPDEAELLRREVIEGLTGELYAADTPEALAWQGFVGAYGAGDDRRPIDAVLDVHSYINSLPDPRGWLDQALAQVADEGLEQRVAGLIASRLGEELTLQIQSAEWDLAVIETCWPDATPRAQGLQAHLDDLRDWALRVSKDPEGVAAEIREYDFPSAGRKPAKCDAAIAEQYAAALKRFEKVRDCFRSRVVEAICEYTPEEHQAGIRAIAPHVAAIVHAVRELDRRFAAAKADRSAIDFGDMQRGALKLLCEGGDAARPSAVARQLQEQYRYVLVDEFQDVDPLQAAILRLVSRESADPPAGNLFAVGDIKQSIYRFRLAEPELFARRAECFRRPGELGRLIPLSENYRSRAEVLEAINAIFNPLMSRAFGGSDYDESARLNPAAKYPAGGTAAFGSPGIELHLLEAEPPHNGAERHSNGDEQGPQDQQDDAQAAAADEQALEDIERQAFLIGELIRAWMGSGGQVPRQVLGKPAKAGDPPPMRPIRYGDIAILLRSAVRKVGPISDVLRRMGIPVRIESPDESLMSTEFRDVHALLGVLDNPRQDYPLGAVLRGPMLGHPFDENDLLSIRLAYKGLPFHQAVLSYARQGPAGELREALAAALQRVQRFRTRIVREPLAEVLWEVLESSGYLAHAAGLPDGQARLARLMQIHEVARSFGGFARQGLRRFLDFLDQVVEREGSKQLAGAAAASEDAVTLMTVHASKGLEFPVVVLAGIDGQFNLQDTTGPVLIHRQLGLGLEARDIDRQIRYTTLLQQVACQSIGRESLAEELRVLYVALTRAREHLVLMGKVTAKAKDEARGLCEVAGGCGATSVPRLKMERARRPVDWLLPALSCMPEGAVDWEGGRPRALIRVHWHERTVTDLWRLPDTGGQEWAGRLAGYAELEPLPKDEPLAEPQVVAAELEAWKFTYQHLEMSSVPARVAVTELKGRWDDQADPLEPERPESRRRRPPPVPVPAFLGGHEDASLAKGTATHRFLQLLDLSGPCDLAGLQAQGRRILEAGLMSRAQVAMICLEDVEWFFATPLGSRVRSAAGQIEREVAFVARMPPQCYDRAVISSDARDALLVRGMVDLLIGQPGGLEILDYKTDLLPAGPKLAERQEKYRRQLATYARCMSAAYARPVTAGWLVFLRARQIVEVPCERQPWSRSTARTTPSI